MLDFKVDCANGFANWITDIFILEFGNVGLRKGDWMAALVSDDSMGSGAGYVLAPIGRIPDRVFSVSYASTGFLRFWSFYRGSLCPHGASLRWKTHKNGVRCVGMCGCFTNFLPDVGLVRKLARKFLEQYWMAVVVGNNSGSSGAGLVAGLVAVRGAVGMEIRPDHAGIYGWTGIIVGKPVNEAEPHGNVTGMVACVNCGDVSWRIDWLGGDHWPLVEKPPEN